MKFSESERLAYARNSQWAKAEIIIASEDTWIHSTAIIGKDGFGFVRDENNELVTMQHVGGVIIEGKVCIGAHTCIDRAVNGYTVIGYGTRIDNLVHVGHGAHVGKHCLIVAGAVLGGSCEIGDYSYIGMGALIKNKIKVGKNVTVGMGAVVTKDIPDGETWIGNPACKMDKKPPPPPPAGMPDIQRRS
jgi:UDP-3-O-[3-hydroxymyristoyl] glucosamine N-acyltransferase